MTDPAASPIARQRCINPDCAHSFPVDRTLVACPDCGALLDIDYDWDRAWPEGGPVPRSFAPFEARESTRGARASTGSGPASDPTLDFSGVWRFRELLPFWKHARNGSADIVTIGEGRTNLQRADALAEIIGLKPNDSADPGAHAGNLYLQYEGFNPTGSFKDNGMCAAFTHARIVGATRVACASTGNTSASLALYASLTGFHAYVFIGDGKIAFGKLSQALEYGSTTLQIAGDFDACLAHVRHIAEHRPELGVYLMNSVNPFRLEGQKTIMLRILSGLDWHVPDWIVCPGGNLGNCSAFGKAFIELKRLGLIDRVPRLAVINAKGASTLDRIYNGLNVRWDDGHYDRAAVSAEYQRMDDENERARTIASAIEINRPVNLPKALRALDFMDGVVRSVDDHCIAEHKALIGRHGFGCEPASAASVAGARMLIAEGVIKPTDSVACVLTGHVLKDPDATVHYHTGMKPAAPKRAPGADVSIPLGRQANQPIRVPDSLEAIIAAMR